ncbi:hypothetical protein RJ639_025884 [Escallonia herrerae]|uniref:Protein kinase domain-containing protein n=1 Tax=Escallonia herrerae TaxID=1293975 RepID=A0AA88S5V3_9ASTE|nr:hypothetical protein RJ639_025884 [Escallonia herrerae]
MTAIFHRDITPGNILLDENYRDVLSDFGLSRSVPLSETHLTTTVGGTYGYLDLDYFRPGQFSDKSDVYVGFDRSNPIRWPNGKQSNGSLLSGVAFSDLPKPSIRVDLPDLADRYQDLTRSGGLYASSPATAPPSSSIFLRSPSKHFSQTTQQNGESLIIK